MQAHSHTHIPALMARHGRTLGQEKVLISGSLEPEDSPLWKQGHGQQQPWPFKWILAGREVGQTNTHSLPDRPLGHAQAVVFLMAEPAPSPLYASVSSPAK